ncbi:hypothetical protein GCWU000342_00756 [Shuttleworthella satelles DSM 14600]|uniref:Uncharacterized protein n=1 Tax=Shuttleworthella satelles DSM 14600 TaxID=626523 RepID=C4G9V2_9FIRM|nr:hypothetical protein GCWU000342_00756 [Shuttleworthia satelles DSM 14600]
MRFFLSTDLPPANFIHPPACPRFLRQNPIHRPPHMKFTTDSRFQLNSIC